MTIKTTSPSGINLFNISGIPVPINEVQASGAAGIVFSGENRELHYAELVYTNESGIVEINQKHLNREYVTDVISFHYHNDNEPVEGTIYCCVERILEQAKELNQHPKEEFFRILIHGLLHLIGYDDHTSESKTLMTEKENHYLDLLREHRILVV